MTRTVVVITNPGADLGAARTVAANETTGDSSPGADLRAARTVAANETTGDSSGLASAIAGLGLEIRPMFGDTETRLIARAESLGSKAAPGTARASDAGLNRFFEVFAPDERAEELAAQIALLPDVAGAYVQPDPAPATVLDASTAPPSADGGHEGYGVNLAQPSADPVPPTTPNFVPRQNYRDPAPGGIDVAYAWSKPGGRGAGIRVIDCEGAWRFTHEDLRQNQGGVIGPETSDLGWRNHGTAVVGVIGADDNGFGVIGIAPDAMVRGSSIFGAGGLAAALTAAANALNAGDIILIEVQYGHPVRGYTSVEWWPAEYAAIRYAVGRGIIVVEAAGNGNNNLDDPIYDTPLAGFPADWRNAFRRGARDSGAILVGAGAPPPGTHGRNLYGADRSRLDFSNYGAAIDVQGWGREVTTTGYGDYQGGSNEDLWYTDEFSGTSSASPIVVGALASVQGALRAAGRPMLTPASARTLLRTTGSPQQDTPGRPVSQRIGNRPNLRQMIDSLFAIRILPVALHRYWNGGPTTDHFYTTNWAELGSGRHGWGYEGIQCYIYSSAVPGTVPLHRYWNAGIGDHFYTTNWAELGSGRHGWGYEGIQGYVRPSPAPGAVPLYRYWNAGIGDHFYTTNWAELGGGRHGWGYEGIQCYVYATPAAAPGADDAAPAAEGVGETVDFALKAINGAAGGAEAGTPVPFAQKAASSAIGAAQAPSEESVAPTTDWTSAAAASKLEAHGVTININLTGARGD